ncbi:MAG: prepilin peptidase [Armatimonadetes bacterium]|nr:MAG: prepilin peptidase [Armatimonadota bacterium]
MTAVAGFIFGIILGSFSKAAAGRVVANETIWGRSYCPQCKKTLRWYDLFPVISFLFLKGRCRYCNKAIPKEDFAAEVVIGIIISLLFISVFIPQFWSISTLSLNTLLIIIEVIFKSFVVVVAAMIFWVDLKSGLIPNIITYPAAVVSFLYLVLISAIKSWSSYQSVIQSTFGQYLLPPYSDFFTDRLWRIWSMLFINFLSGLGAASVFALLIIITRGRGMGWGDVKYAFLLGLILGFPGTVVAIFLAFLFGAVVSLFLISLRKKSFGQTIPFGPFLSLGALSVLLWGENLISWYLNLF